MSAKQITCTPGQDWIGAERTGSFVAADYGTAEAGRYRAAGSF